jgi:ligand-binding sensor domain-containing protein
MVRMIEDRSHATCRRWAPRVSAVLLASCLPALAPHTTLALDAQKALTQYRVRVWQTDQGLPNNHVQAILQTRDGFLWIGTEEGVARFDGTSFRVFDRSNTPDLRLNSVMALLEDAEGTLWVGTRGGVNRYRDGRWMAALTTEEGLPSVRAICLLQRRDGSVLIGTEGGLARFADGKLAAVTTDQGRIADSVTSLAEDPAGGLWIATEGGGLLQVAEGRLTRYTTQHGLRHDNVTRVAVDPQGGLWLATARGLGRFENGRFTSLAGAQGVDAFALGMLLDRGGSLWVGTATAGLFRLRDGRATSLNSHLGLTSDSVEALYEDRQGTLWVGTNGGGLVALTDERFTSYGAAEGLADHATSIYEDGAGTVWVGTRGGVTGLRPGGGKLTYTTAQGLSHDTVFTLTGGRDGSLWIGTRAGGVNQLKNGRWRAYGKSDGLGSDDVRALEEDREGNLWVGTKGGGLSRLTNGRITTYTTADGLSSNHVSAVRQTRDGDLWIGTHAGLNRLRNGRFHVFGTNDGLASDAIHVLWESADGVLWIGTAGGLVRFAAGRFTSYTTAQGLHDDLVLALVDDERGHLWMGCNKGIFRVSKRQLDDLDQGHVSVLTPEVYSMADGLRSNEANGVFQNTAWRSRDGRLWFAMYKGLAMVDADWEPPSAGPTPVYLETVRADRRPVVETPAAAELPPGRGELEFQFSAIELRHPERVRYKYKLEGYDHEWIEAGTRRSAYYTNLPAGHYRFQVLASTVEGSWSGQGSATSLYLRPHFYQTRWFYALCVLAAVGLAIGIHRLRVRKLRLREKELEGRVQEAIANLRMLRGLLPICAWCKNIRDDKGYWMQLEGYISQHSEADFSHGICPTCAEGVAPRSTRHAIGSR